MKLFAHKKKQSDAPSLPVLQTERLVLRNFDLNDAVDLYAYAQSPNVGPMAGWKPHETIEESRLTIQRFIEGGEVWAIVEKRTGRVVGSVGLHKDDKRSGVLSRELGYALGENYWGQGIASESCRAALEYAFDALGCNVVSVSHFPFNQKSKRLIKKLGFQYEGTLRRAWLLPDGTTADLLCYSLTKEEFEAAAATAKGEKKPDKQEDKACRH